MQWFALASLLVSCTSLVWLNATRVNSCVFTALLFGASRSPVELHTTAVLTRSGCVRQCWSGRRCSRRTTSRPAFAPSAARSGPRATPTSPASPTSPGASGRPGGAPGCAVARAAAPTRGTRACEMMGSKSRRCPVIFSTGHTSSPDSLPGFALQPQTALRFGVSYQVGDPGAGAGPRSRSP